MSNRQKRRGLAIRTVPAVDEEVSVMESPRMPFLSRWPTPVCFVAIGLLALVLRVVCQAETASIASTVRLLGDAATYYAWAERIAAGAWYGDETFYQAPLYPYVLAILIKFGGLAVPGIRLTQALWGTLACVLLAAATKKLFGLRTAVVAGVMMATYAPAIYYDGIVQKTSLASVLLCAFLWASLSVQTRLFPSSETSPNESPEPPPRSATVGRDRTAVVLCLLAGVLLGLLVLTRENALLWIALLPVWLLWLPSAHSSRAAKFGLVAALIVGLALVLVPVAARNASLGGEWSPTTFQAGPNFYIGNRANASGIYEPLVLGRETPVYERTDAHRLAERESGRELTPREVSRFWFAKSWSEIREAPAGWIVLLFRKTAMVVNHYEVPDVESLFIHQQYSVVLQMLSWWQFGLLAPLAAMGIVMTGNRWRQLVLLDGLIIMMVVAIVGFFLLGRYRFPLVPLLIPFAAVSLIEVFELIFNRKRKSHRQTDRPWRRLGAAGAVGILVAVASHLPIHRENQLNASSVMNVGVAAGQQGDLRMAITLLEQSNRMKPDDAETNFNLGIAYQQTGRGQRALAYFVKAVQLEPNLMVANFQLAVMLERLGRSKDAAVFYTRVLEIDPDQPRVIQALRRLNEQSP